MTTKEKLRKMLTDRGMSDNQADEVLKEAIPQIEGLTPGYKITWDRPASEYPDVVYNVLWLSLCDAAKKWIDANAPEAWYRPMFA
ncbi:MAG: hypothetical protein ABH888_03170 [Patescibacteria group bacterium]